MRNKLSYIIVFVILTTICINSIYRMSQIYFIQDDAYITLRYVENFINGNGLVFNQGERVEGFTNFLWLILLSITSILAKIISLQIELSFVPQLFSLLSGVTLLVFSFYFTKRFLKEKFEQKNTFEKIAILFASLIPPLLISFSSPFLYWGVSGMESTLFTLLALISVYRYLFNYKKKPDLVFVSVSVLNTMLRPEGLLIFFLITSHSIIVNKMKSITVDGESNRKLFVNQKEIILYVLPVLVLLIFRLIYYGYPLPNTFYAKTGYNLEHFHRGLDYVIDGIINQFLYGILLFVPLFNLRKGDLQKATFFFYFFVLTYLALIVLIGGDVLPIDRFLLPILPLVLIFSTVTIYQVIKNPLSLIVKTVLLFTLMFVFSFAVVYSYVQSYDLMETKRSYEIGLVHKMKVYAEWVKKKQIESDKKITVALSTIGAFSFYSGVKVIDIVGLTDEYIAHNPKEVPGIDEELPVLWKERRYNAEYVLQQNPDYIIFPAGAKPTAFAECAIFVQPEFYKNYYCQLFYSEELKQMLPIFTKRTEPLQINPIECDTKFIKPYIEANNLFIEMNSKKRFELLSQILDKCDEAEKLCKFRKSDIDALRGFSFYHYGDIDNAKLFFESSVSDDSLNMISWFYLVKAEKGNERELLNQYRFIKKYSPDLFPANYISE